MFHLSFRVSIIWHWKKKNQNRSLQLRRVIQPWQSCDLHEPLGQVTVLSAEERNTFGQKCHEKNQQINLSVLYFRFVSQC